MSSTLQRRIANMAILATITELTNVVIQELDGRGLNTSDNPISNKVLNDLIASRITSGLNKKLREV